MKIKEEFFNPAYKKEAGSFTMFNDKHNRTAQFLLKQVFPISDLFLFKKVIITALKNNMQG